MSSTEVNFSLSLAGFDIVIRVRCTTLTSACMLNFLMGACTVKCQKISLSRLISLRDRCSLYMRITPYCLFLHL
jgi:hypothetical protein